MKVSDEIRRERKAAVLRAMQKLRAAFPLQPVKEGADPALRAAYVKALSHWALQGTPPQRDFAANEAVQELVTLDALVIDECGIGCYPFSARDTGIHYLSDIAIFVRSTATADKISFGLRRTPGTSHRRWQKSRPCRHLRAFGPS